jgi:Arabinose efflux permease
MKPFFVVWGGQFISVLGSGLSNFGIVFWLYQKTGAATPFAIAALTSVLPMIIFAPVAGSLADRWNRKKLMIIADSCDAVVTLCILGLVAAGRLEPWMVYVLSFFGSTFATFQSAAYSAAVPTLVPESQLARANGLISVSQASSNILPPAIAGALIGSIGLQGLIVIDLCSYAFAVAGALATRIPQPVAVKTSDEDGPESGLRAAMADAAFGFRYLADRRPLLLLVIYFSLVNFCLQFLSVLLGPLVIPIGGSAGYGLAQTVIGLGSLAGGLVVSVWGGPKKRRMPWVVGGLGGSALGLGIVGLRPQLGLIALGLFAMMICLDLGGAIWSSVIQRKIEPGAMGRVNGARSILAGALMPFAYLLAGPLADKVFGPLFAAGGGAEGTFVARIVGVGPGRGIGFMLVASAALLALGSFAAAASPHIMRLDEEIPDAATGTQEPEPQDAETSAKEQAPPLGN